MNGAIQNAIGVDGASNGYNTQSTELNIAQSEGFCGGPSSALQVWKILSVGFL